jgi:hypothetical protein
VGMRTMLDALVPAVDVLVAGEIVLHITCVCSDDIRRRVVSNIILFPCACS